MDYLDELESESIYVIREAYCRFRRIAMLWSVGKDSTTLLWLCRKAFFGHLSFLCRADVAPAVLAAFGMAAEKAAAKP